jgi:hypothetical protein
MTLTDRIAAELRFVGLHDYPVAKRIAQIVREANRPWWRLYVVSVLLAFMLGFGLDYLWHGVQITAIQENLVTWRNEYQAEHVKHHAAELKPTSKAQARVIVQGKEDGRRDEP